MEKFNTALSIIFYVIWIPLGILLAVVLFLYLSSNMGKIQTTDVPQGGQVQQPGGEVQLQQGKQQIPQSSGVPQPGGQQNLQQPPPQAPQR